MKNIGCGGAIIGLILLSVLISVAKDPVGGPILLVVVIGLIGLIAYLVLKPKGKAAYNGDSVKTQSPEQRRTENLIRLSKSLPNSGISPIPLKQGEELVYKLYQVSLIESRSNGSTYQGGSRGVSLRIAKGVSYRIGASKGQLVRNPESLQIIDQGTATFTNKRLIFAGTKASREWSFDKLTDISQSADGATVLLSVSNRQKPSGITSSDSRDLEAVILATIAMEYNQNGLSAAKGRCLSEAGVSTAVSPIAEETQAVGTVSMNRIQPEPTFKEGIVEARQATKPYSAQISEGDDLVDVVGESFYAEAFETLRSRYNIDYDSTEDFNLDVVAEPFNKFSKNGHAVAVQLDGLVIGHISEDENTEFFELLKTCNGRAKCRGEIYYAPVAEVMKNSVRLFCDFPPELEPR